MENLSEISTSFRSMNTGVEIVLCMPSNLRGEAAKSLQRTQDLFRKAEDILSRFNLQSELSRLNTAAGACFRASPLLFEVVSEALKASAITGGIFDPTVLPQLVACGYDRSYEKLAGRTHIPVAAGRVTRCRRSHIRLDADYSLIYLPQGYALDLGGIGKGWTVDRAFAELEIYDNLAIDAGGDIRVKGRMANGSPWSIGVADPFSEDGDLMTFEIAQGAVCTSATTRRKWEAGGKIQHHLIDPRTGEPARSGVASATVLAQSAAVAEVISKTALILGAEDGRRFIESQAGASGLLVTDDNQMVYTKGFKELMYASTAL